jgi:hypothetical protein
MLKVSSEILRFVVAFLAFEGGKVGVLGAAEPHSKPPNYTPFGPGALLKRMA